MARYKIHLGDQEVEIDVSRQGDQLRVSRDGQTADLRLLHQDGPAFVLEWLQPDGKRQLIRVAGHAGGDKRQMWVNGRTLTYERIRQRGGGATHDGSLAASIPAVVSQVLVNVGDTVSAGEKLILLESMKMVIPIIAPRDGRVTAVHCVAGESVQAGIPLLELEESS